MKNVLYYCIGVLFSTLFFWGCVANSENIKNKDCSSVKGVWKAEGTPFTIRINNKNEVISANIPMGQVDVYPNKRTQVEVKNGGKSYYDAGDFSCEYLQKDKQLSVEITIKHLYVPFVEDKIEGHVKYTLVGVLSDQCQRWEATLFEVFDYGPRFPMDPNGLAVGEPIVFIKEQKAKGSSK
jgi:hypothetical protein